MFFELLLFLVFIFEEFINLFEFYLMRECLFLNIFELTRQSRKGDINIIIPMIECRRQLIFSLKMLEPEFIKFDNDETVIIGDIHMN